MENVRNDFKSFQKPLKNLLVRTTHSFGVDFIIRKCKTNKTRAHLYTRINVDGELREISLKEDIATSDWIVDKEMIKDLIELNFS